MAEYKITWVDDKPPREWNSPKGGLIYYIVVMVEGQPKPISVGKKSPNALKVGDTISGDIIPKEGYDIDNFKAAPPAGFGGKVDTAEERAKWAIGIASSQPPVEATEERAKQLYAMVDRVKTESPKTSEPYVSKSNPKPEPRVVRDEPEYNPDEIPFE